MLLSVSAAATFSPKARCSCGEMFGLGVGGGLVSVRVRVRIRVRVRVRVRGLGLGLGAYAWRSLGRRHGPAVSTAEASDAAPLCATVGESVPLLPLTHLFGHFIVYAGL